MSRSRNERRHPIGEYWSRRYMMPPKGRYGKRLTHRKERADAHKKIRREVETCDT